jgi:hypothetical protein
MIIYLIQNTSTGKCYVGQTVQSLAARMAQHRSLSNRKPNTQLITKAIAKYGWENFNVEVLEETDEAGLDMAERKWMEIYGPHSPKTRAKINAAAARRVRLTPDIAEAMWRDREAGLLLRELCDRYGFAITAVRKALDARRKLTRPI